MVNHRIYWVAWELSCFQRTATIHCRSLDIRLMATPMWEVLLWTMLHTLSKAHIHAAHPSSDLLLHPSRVSPATLIAVPKLKIQNVLVRWTQLPHKLTWQFAPEVLGLPFRSTLTLNCSNLHICQWMSWPASAHRKDTSALSSPIWSFIESVAILTICFQPKIYLQDHHDNDAGLLSLHSTTEPMVNFSSGLL